MFRKRDNGVKYKIGQAEFGVVEPRFSSWPAKDDKAFSLNINNIRGV